MTGSPQTVCILRLSAIGDCCHTLAVVRTMLAAWPRTRLTWVIGRTEAALFGDIAGIEFITYDKSRGRRANGALRRALADRRFDLLLDMQASWRANLASRAIRAPVRIGFDRRRARDCQWFFTNRSIEARTREHVLDGLFGFAAAAGVRERRLEWNIPIGDDDLAYARDVVPDDAPVVLISPCSSQRARNFRNWPAERYVAVAEHAASSLGAQIVVTGGPTPLERDYAATISRDASCDVLNLAGRTTLKQLLALIERATVIVCPDSGPAHMATAVGTPVVGLYASSNPERTGPYLSRQWTVNRYPDAVRIYLGKTVDQIRWGQRVRHPDVMDLVSVADVTDKLDALFSRSSATG